MNRRGRGEGTIFKRADGRWEARLDLGWRNGKRQRKSFLGRTRQAVARALAVAKVRADRGLPVPHDRQTVEQYLARWLLTVRPNVRPRTFESYELTVRLHVVPAIGRILLSRLTPNDVRVMLGELGDRSAPRPNDRKLSARTISYVRTVLRIALNQAVGDQLIAWNPAAIAKPPKENSRADRGGEPANWRAFDQDEAQRFLATIRGHRLEALFITALALGLRRGEALGVRWQDVDFENATLRIEQSIQRLSRKITDTPGLQAVAPKTPSARRALSMPASVARALRTHRARQAEERLGAGTAWKDSGLVFTNYCGGPLEPNIVRNAFKKSLQAAGLVDMRFHDLRHSAATLLLHEDVSLKVLQELLGHSQFALTAKVYAHVKRRALDEAAQKMDRILNA